jgi:hypothetical protein
MTVHPVHVAQLCSNIELFVIVSTFGQEARFVLFIFCLLSVASSARIINVKWKWKLGEYS